MAVEFLNTTQVARRLGVGPSTVKRWADDGVLPCVRTAGGHRRFHAHEVERFVGGMSGSAEPGSATSEGLDVELWIDRLLGDLEPMRLHAGLLDERGRLGSWWRVVDGLGQVVTEFGERWRRGELEIAAEHRATTRLVRALVSCVTAIPVASNAPRCLLVTIEEDFHTLGLSFVEAVAREAGWSCDWIGGPTPTDAIVTSIVSRRPQLVALSASSWSSDPNTLRQHAERIGEACREVGAELLLGGNGAWPEQPAYGARLRTLRDLHEELQALASLRVA